MPTFKTHKHKIFYREEGSGSLLLILPGNTATSICHKDELEYFGSRYHVVSLDFWGTGQSERIDIFPNDWWEQGAHDAAALVGHLGYQQCIVMGTSGGASIALLMAILHPELVRGVIADSTVEYFHAPSLSQEVQKRLQRTAEQVQFWKWAQGNDWQQVVEADSDLLLRFEEQGGDYFRGRLKELHCPVLLTASERDECLPKVKEQLEAMANQMKKSHLFLAKEGSHPLMWSCTDEFRKEADLFLASLKNWDC